MYELRAVYGKAAYDKWCASRPDDLEPWQTSPHDALCDTWVVDRYRDLVECVAFLTVMNKRLSLFFRGQSSDTPPTPRLFRDEWWPPGGTRKLRITAANRGGYFSALADIGDAVYRICKPLGLPRWRGLRDIREVQWAVIQHYELWPTPLIDLTASLRVAASFALGIDPVSGKRRDDGFIYVVGMPAPTGSVHFDIDEHVVLARLHSCCPPIAIRPHLQDGFLVGRIPFSAPDTRAEEKSNLSRRLIAKFRLENRGEFWDEVFPPIPMEALLPPVDPLMDAFLGAFAPGQPEDLNARAMRLGM